MTQCETAEYLASNRILILVLVEMGILPAEPDEERLRIKSSDLDRMIALGVLPRPAWSN